MEEQGPFAFLDKKFEEFARAHRLPGAIYGLVEPSGKIHIKTLGLANVQKQQPVSPQTHFRIASMTKSFVGVAFLILKTRNFLCFEDLVSKHLGEAFVNSVKNSKLTTDSQPITIRHLLNMTAGFPSDDPWGDRCLDDTQSTTDNLLAAGLTHSNIVGLQHEYSNLSYALLGQVIQSVTKQSFQDFIKFEILDPLGMSNTHFEFSAIPEDEFAQGYRWRNDTWEPEESLHDGTFGAMGGLITTIEDFAKYTRFHLNSWPPRDDRDDLFVRRGVLREMHHPGVVTGRHYTNYRPQRQYICGYNSGLRYQHDFENDIVYIGHGGGLPGWGSDWKFVPHFGFGVISFANLTYAPMYQWSEIAIFSLLSAAKPVFHRPQPEASEILKERANNALHALRTNEWDIPFFAKNFFLDTYLEDWKERVKVLLDKFGKIGEITKFFPENNLCGSFEVACEGGVITCEIALNPENPPKIQTLSWTYQ